MFKAKILLALVLLTAATAHQENLRVLWESWKSNYGVSYDSYEDDDYRFSVFVDNHHFIEQFNQDHPKTVLSLNQFAHMTYDEFIKQYGNPALSELIQNEENSEDFLNAQPVQNNVPYTFYPYPPSWNWVDNGVMEPVQDQGMCGSCWAFAATSGNEAVFTIRHGIHKKFSEQQLVDCETASFGCNGGFPDRALNYIALNGQMLEDSYPYKATDGTCQYESNLAYKAGTTGAMYVTPNSANDLKSAIFQQPTIVLVEVSRAIMYYTGGVIDKSFECGTDINHAVVAVGYGTFMGQEAIMIRNSWGQNWGVNGHVFISTNDDNNGAGTCSLFSFPIAPAGRPDVNPVAKCTASDGEIDTICPSVAPFCYGGNCVQCRDGNDCNGQACKNHQCTICGNDEDCMKGQFCYNFQCKACDYADGCKGCSLDYDCGVSEYCNAGVCRPGCRGDTPEGYYDYYCAAMEICRDHECVQCAADGDCWQGVCRNNVCTGCTQDWQCEDSQYCNLDNNECAPGCRTDTPPGYWDYYCPDTTHPICHGHKCVQCASENDCWQGICQNGQCVGCSNDWGCPDTQYCDLSNNECTDGCRDDTPAGYWDYYCPDSNRPICQNHQCVQCAANSDCYNSVCKNGQCVGCTTDFVCQSNQYCNMLNNECTIGCRADTKVGFYDATCPSSAKYCRNHNCVPCQSSNFDCPVASNGGYPVCSNYQCVNCKANSDCSSMGTYRCDIASGKCLYGCKSKSDCTGTNFCSTSGACKACTCANGFSCFPFVENCKKTCRVATDCRTLPGTTCRDTKQGFSVCAACLFNADCGAGKICSSNGICVTGTAGTLLMQDRAKSPRRHHHHHAETSDE